ncbi:MAG: hypothetical protein WBX25_30530 [Rhodomicrobium sp.]
MVGIHAPNGIRTVGYVNLLYNIHYQANNHLQGLTSVPVVILNGGTSTPPVAAGNQPVVLFADKSARVKP